MLPRPALADVGLAVLAVTALASAAYVVASDPQPVEGSRVPRAAVATASPPALPSPAVIVTPAAQALDAVLLRSRTTPSGHVAAAARLLRWNLTNAGLDGVGLDDVQGREVVLVQVGQDDQTQALQVLPRLRRDMPAARLVVVAPLVTVNGGPAPGRLAAAVEEVGGELLDPAALGWLQAPVGLFSDSGSFTPDGAQAVGSRLAEALG